MKGDQAKQAGKTARRSRLVRGRGWIFADEGVLCGGQSEEGHQAFWNPEEAESDPLMRGVSGVAGQPLVP